MGAVIFATIIVLFLLCWLYFLIGFFISELFDDVNETWMWSGMTQKLFVKYCIWPIRVVILVPKLIYFCSSELLLEFKCLKKLPQTFVSVIKEDLYS